MWKLVRLASQLPLDPIPKVVLQALAGHINKGNVDTCIVRLVVLQEDCRISRSSLVRALAGLESEGFIRRTRRGFQRANLYKMNIDRCQKDTPEKDQGVSERNLKGVPRKTPKGVREKSRIFLYIRISEGRRIFVDRAADAP